MLDAMGQDPAACERIDGLTRGATTNPQWSIRVAPEIAFSARKRLFDIAISLILLMLFLPLLLAAIISIKLDSRGPVFFRQRRTGLNGKVFTILKLRTMLVLEDAQGLKQATRNDDRVTRLGALLRQTSLDELPQLTNVLRGDMSIVGPRPHAIAHDVYYGGNISHYPLRFRVRPGLTGLAQIRGFRGETKNIKEMSRRVTVDNFYIENWSLMLDVAILFNTARIFLIDRRAY